jgi:replication-associated recombination protein RarA
MSNRYEPQTKRGHNFYEVASALQKEIRRGNTKLAGYWALELFHSGFSNYCWKRLLTISAEDCWGILTNEIKSLHDSFLVINQGVPKTKEKGRIFISKAVIILCACKKNRDPDHLQNFVYDGDMDVAVAELEKSVDESKGEVVPEYAFDVHTKKGKLMGKTKKDFFKDEQQALFPFQAGLFDHLIP